MSVESSAPRTLPLPRPGAPPVPTPPNPQRFTLQSGLRVVAVSRTELPQLAMRVIVPAGSAADPDEQPGTASLVGSLLSEGTERRTALELNQTLDNLGAAFSVRVGHDFTEVDLRLLAETADEGLELLAEVLARSTFPDREVERVRSEALDALQARLDEPANVADDVVAVSLFGPEHPYGRLPLGTSEGVRGIRRDSLLRFHRDRFRPQGSVLVVAGDFEPELLSARLERIFAGWTGSAHPTRYPAPPASPFAASSPSRIAWEDAAQGEIRFAGLGIDRRSPDWIPAAVANYILGGSTITGRLGANLREDKGWTYGVRSGFAAGIHPAGWTVETAVDADVIEEALREIEAELNAIAREAVEDEELFRAKEALILSLPRAFETPARIVARLATLEAFGLPEDYWAGFPARVAAVTAEEVNRIARSLFHPERLVRVTVGPPEGEN
jgi:zinc protease